MIKSKFFIGLLFCSVLVRVQQDSIVISGRVLNKEAEPLINAGVYSEKSKLGTTTNSLGGFILKVPKNHSLFASNTLVTKLIMK